MKWRTSGRVTLRQPTKNPQTKLWARQDLVDSLCREKDLRVCRASCPNCRHSLDNRGWFSRDRFHFRKFHEQYFNLALLMRRGQAGLCHDAILSRRGEKKQVGLHHMQGTICENLLTSPQLCTILVLQNRYKADRQCVMYITDNSMLWNREYAVNFRRQPTT